MPTKTTVLFLPLFAMNQYLHILQSPAHTHRDGEQPAVKQTCSSGALPAHRLSKLIRGANGYLSSAQDEKTSPEAGEIRKTEERKHILALRMKNVSPPPPVAVCEAWRP